MIMNKSGTYGVYWSLEHRIGWSRCPVLVSPNTTKGDSFLGILDNLQTM